jgi:hypothetical protein
LRCGTAAVAGTAAAVLLAAVPPLLLPPASEPLLLPVPTDKPAPELSVRVTVAALRGVCCTAVVLGAPLPSVALLVAAAAVVATFSGDVSTVVADAAGVELEWPAAAAASAAAAAPEDVSILRGTEA